MNSIKVLTSIYFVLLFALTCLAQEKVPFFDKQEYFELITNSEIQASTKIGDEIIKTGGKLKLRIQYSKGSLEEGVVYPKSINLVFFNVEQSLITNEIKTKHRYGGLSISLDKTKDHKLKYSKKDNLITGTLSTFIDASIFNQLVSYSNPKETDLELTPTIPAMLNFKIQLEDGLENKTEPMNKLGCMVQLNLSSKSTQIEGIRIPAIELEILEPFIEVEIADLFLFESTRSLCLQPVFIQTFDFTWKKSFGWPSIPIPIISIETTGAGLEFGIPELERQWSKANVIFEIRDPMIIYTPQYRIFEYDVDRDDLLDQVDEDDCIEVFFVHEFNPNDFYGGGFTAGAGTQSAKVVSSDENAVHGIDQTHLAHEIGHVLGLVHPEDSETTSAVPGSSGTLICGSGFMFDNPKKNSVENMDLIDNSLLNDAFRIRSYLLPDCENSDDCGACPR